MSALFTSREQGSDTHYSRRVKEDRSGKRHHRGGTKERFRFREGYAAEARRSERRRERESGSEIGAKSGRDRTERTKVGKKRPYISHGISPASSNTPYLRIDTQFPASLAPIEGSLRLIAAAPFDFK